jgi:hypothetical protein
MTLPSSDLPANQTRRARNLLQTTSEVRGAELGGHFQDQCHNILLDVDGIPTTARESALALYLVTARA